MSELIDIIISAVDNASSIFSSVTSSAEEMESEITSAAEEGASDFDEMGAAAENAGESVESISSAAGEINGGGLDDAASAADSLENEAYEADTAIQSLNDDLGIINSSMLLQLGEQVGQLGSQAESMAQDMNTAAISVGQLATQAGIAEPEMVALINNISNATFPNDEAMMYVKVLSQIGVEASNLGTSATGLDRINDAFGLGAEKTASLAQELSVLGVDMNNVSDSFNALAYANANTVGGMENYYTFLRKYDAQFKELGLNVDQASVLIAAATHKFGGGRAALSGLSDALKESNGDLRALEEALDMAPGSLENASQLTGQYAGQLDKLADEEAEHKSLLDQLGAAWEDLSLSLSPVLEPLASAIGLIGQIGSFGIQIGGLKTLRQTIISVATSLGILTAAEETNTVAEEANTVATEGNTIAKTLGSAIESIAAVATTAYAAIVGVLTGEIGLVTAATMIWNAVLAANPVMLVVLALAALVAIIYEVGKAFGWWKDVNSMLQAIWAGIQRLWSAFINHPDVQAIIQALTNAWNWLVGAIGNAWNAVMKFLGISTGGKFDVVRAIIDGIGAAWNFLKAPIQFVIGLVQKFVGAIQWLWNGFNNLLNSLGPFGDLLLIIMGPIGWIIEGFRMLSDVLSGNGAKWGWLGGILQRVVGFFQWVASGIQWVIGGLTNLWNAFTGSSIVQGILNGITAAFNWLYNGIMWVVNGVNSFISAITGGSMSGVGDILSGIGAAWELLQEPISQVVQFITDFATAIWNVLTGQQDLQSAMSDIWNSLRDNVGSAIWSILELLGNFVLNAFQYAWQAGQQFVYNLGMWFAQLPGKVWNYLVQVKNHIVNVATQWVNQGKQKAQQFLMGVLNFLIQLPIRVKNYLLQVLSNIISAGAQWVSNAKSKASELVSGAVSTISSLPNKIASALSGLVEAIVKPFREAYNKAKEYWDQITSMGGARGGDLPSAMGGDLPGVSSYTSSSNEVSLEHNLNINLNIDAPGHINTEQLGEILSDRGFIRELVNNRDFQLLDSEAKERLNLKMNRARGV